MRHFYERFRAYAGMSTRKMQQHPMKEEGHRFGLVFFFFMMAFISFWASPVQSEPHSAQTTPNALIEYLNQEKEDLIRANKENSVLLEPPTEAALQQQITQNAASFTLIHAKISNLENFLTSQYKTQKRLGFKIRKTMISPGASKAPEAQAELSRLNTLNNENNNIIALINENLSLAHHFELLLKDAKHQLEEWSAKKQGVLHIEALQKKIEQLQQSRHSFYEKNIQLQRAFKNKMKSSNSYDAQLGMQLNNHEIALINAQISLIELQIKKVKSNDVLISQHDIKTISSSVDMDKDNLEQLEEIKQSLLNMKNLLKEEQQYLSDKIIKQRAVSLEEKITTVINQVDEAQKQLSESLDIKQQELKKQLSVRQTLSSYQISSWITVKNEFSRAPLQIQNYFTKFAFKLKDAYFRQPLWRSITMWLSLLLIYATATFIQKKIKVLTQDKTRSRLSAHLYDGFLILLARNSIQIALLTMLLIAFLMIQLPFSTYSLLIDIFLVWFIFRNLILIARLTLLERVHDVSGKDTRFFYRLKWLLIAGGTTTICMVLSQQIPLAVIIQDVFTRLFMLFIFASACVMWISKDVFPLLLRPVLKNKKPYLRKAISLLFLLLPLALLTTAMMGLIGYMNLAWSLSRYQVYLVLVIIGYVLIRGLLSDALELISEWMILSLRNGWLWIEVFLKPFYRILHLLLFFASVLLLFQLLGVYTEMPVLAWLQRLGRYELVDVSGVHITLTSTLEFVIVLSVFVWAAKWTREFCYRWLYVNSRDEGIRNSLSVFTQYAVILLGGYITLRVLGLDFSGMSMILGGLAVGMGFGLRDFASNIVGGVMLLIERPVREGDLITIGSHEGRVSHIGIRSMRVSSWDNTEVLIPNAETFNKPFINWTHQDSVVRTVVPIKVSRDDDPLLIQQLIFEVLAIIPEILDEPPTQVFLKHIDDALVEFEVRYFINVENNTRFEVRSKFLFALTAQFKAAGIKPPIPPISVELKESARNDIGKKSNHQ